MKILISHAESDHNEDIQTSPCNLQWISRKASLTDCKTGIRELRYSQSRPVYFLKINTTNLYQLVALL